MITAHDIIQSPTWFPLESDGDAMRLVRLDEAAYRAASFLDQRLLKGGYEQAKCSAEVIRAAGAQLPIRAHYIFHTGHVGSTLISRLIGEHERIFSVREPALLRTLLSYSQQPGGVAILNAVRALLSRTWRPQQRAVVKVTSFANELAETLLTGADDPAAIFMFASPLAYLRGILGGPNSRVEARMLAPGRLQRLARRLGEGAWRPDPGSEGEHIAMSWLCEMTVLHQAASRCGSRVLWVDFDAFLGNPADGLQAIFRVLGADMAWSDIEALVGSPLMNQYSKAPEYAYDAALRQEVLMSADQEHAQEIRRGMLWLRNVATRHALVAEVLERSARV